METLEMSKVKKVKKTAVQKTPARAPNLVELLDRLKKGAGPKGTRIAELLIAKYPPEVINLAFRLLPKVGATRLSNREETEYQKIKAIDPATAEKWKNQRLSEKQKK